MSEHSKAAICDWPSGDLRIFMQQTGHFANEKSMTLYSGVKESWDGLFLFVLPILCIQPSSELCRVHDSKPANIPTSNQDFRSIRYILAGFCIDRACWILECSLWEDKHMQQKAEKKTIGVFYVQGSQLIRCRMVLFLHNRAIEDMG